jgi:hypothetical protein
MEFVPHAPEVLAKRTAYPCQCCGFLTLTDPATGSYEICPVCFWEDDPVQNEDAAFSGGANSVSLAQARENYIQCSACKPEFSGKVRPPRINEVPSPTVIAQLDSVSRAGAIRGIKAIILGVVRAMRAGQIGTLEGCCGVAAVAWPLNEPELDEILRTFEAVASEVDEFPTGGARDLWSPEALRIKDAEATEYELRVRNTVQNACSLLQERLETKLQR